MSQLNVHFLMWFTNKSARSLGFWGLLAIVFLMISGIFFTVKVFPMKNEIHLMDEFVKKQASMPRIVQPIIEAPKNNTAEQIEKFYARFPDASTLPAWLEAIDDAAIKQQLELNRGDYKLNQVNKSSEKLKENNLLRYEIILPVKGSYIQIRKFIALILKELPMLALSDFQITRENVTSSTVDARLLFVLFLKETSS